MLIKHKVIIRLLFMVLVFAGCDLEQHNPRPHWDREEHERINSKNPPPKLNADGTVPTAQMGEAPGTDGEHMKTDVVTEKRRTFDVKIARAKYDALCVSCHGASGKGETPMAKALKPSPRNFSLRRWQDSVSDTSIYNVVAKGGGVVGLNPAMPPFENILTKEEIAGIVSLIRTF